MVVGFLNRVYLMQEWGSYHSSEDQFSRSSSVDHCQDQVTTATLEFLKPAYNISSEQQSIKFQMA